MFAAGAIASATNDGVRGDFEGKISSDLPKNPRSNSDGFTANSMKNTLKMPDFCFSFSVTHFCNTSQHFPNIRSRNKALPFHARRCQCCHTSRVCSEEYAFFIVCNNNRKIVFLIELAHVVIPVRFQSGDDLGELRLGAPMDTLVLQWIVRCFIKIPLVFYSTKRYEKSPSSDGLWECVSFCPSISLWHLTEAGCRAVTGAVPRALFMVKTV